MDGGVDIHLGDKQPGIEQFVYTHKGRECLCHPAGLGFGIFFTEILTSQNGFARKPTQKRLGIC